MVELSKAKGGDGYSKEMKGANPKKQSESLLQMFDSFVNFILLPFIQDCITVTDRGGKGVMT